MQNPKFTGALLLSVLFFSLFVSLSHALTTEQPQSSALKEGNKVYTDTAAAYISAAPHTLSADGYLYVNVTSKLYGGNVDLCFGFDSSFAFPTSLDVYNPRNETTTQELALSYFWSKPGYIVEYNFSRKEGDQIFNGAVCVSINQSAVGLGNETSISEGNQTAGNESLVEILALQHFDSGDLVTKIFKWNTTELLYWSAISTDLRSNKQTANLLGMNTWYCSPFTVQKGVECNLRVWLTLVPTLDSIEREFFIGFKPQGKSLEQALADGSFNFLDPWYNAEWNYRKNHTIDGATGAGLGYQVCVRVHSGSGTDYGVDMYCGGKCRADFGDIRFTNSNGDGLLDYWVESIENNVSTCWVKVSEDLSTARLIYVYYGNPGALTTSSGSATFDFFDDFSLSPNGWTLINGATISGGALSIYGGSGVVADKVKQRPSYGYDNYRFRFLASCAATSWGWFASGRDAFIRAWDYYYDPLSGSWGGPTVYGPGGIYGTFSPLPARDALSHVMELVKVGTSYSGSWSPSSFVSVVDATPESGVSVRFGHWGGLTAPAVIDWVFLSRYVNPEPTHGSWGQEETSGGGGGAPAAWAPYDWRHRRSHVINDSTCAAGNDYCTRIHVYRSGSGASGENVYLDGNCRSDFGDIRFTGSDGYTLLSYWVESLNDGSDAVFWVKIADNLSVANRTMYVYYNNSAASTLSNGSGTFLFFDDFSSGLGKWSVQGGSWSIVNGELWQSDSGVTWARNFAVGGPWSNVCVRAKIKLNSGFAAAYVRGRCSGSSLGYEMEATTLNARLARDESVVFAYDGSQATSVFYDVKLGMFGSSISGMVDSTTLSATDSCNTVGGVALRTYQTAAVFDDVYVRKYVNPEPNHGSWGSQEIPPVGVTLWGTSTYADYNETIMGGAPERVLSGNVSNDIHMLFANAGRYDSANYWGLDTQPPSAYGNISASENYYVFSAFFYKGHSYDGSCSVPDCTFHHYAIYDNEGPPPPPNPPSYDNVIQDHLVNNQMNYDSYRFVVLWTCGSAWENATGGFSGSHSWGWEASFMGTAELNADAYTETTDSSGRCFIGFDNFSIWYRTSTLYENYNYGDFVTQFLYHLLQGRTVRESLNRATWDTHNSTSIPSFASCPLRTGYTMVDPREPWPNVTCWMRVRGDGDLIIPR